MMLPDHDVAGQDTATLIGGGPATTPAARPGSAASPPSIHHKNTFFHGDWSGF